MTAEGIEIAFLAALTAAGPAFGVMAVMVRDIFGRQPDPDVIDWLGINLGPFTLILLSMLPIARLALLPVSEHRDEAAWGMMVGIAISVLSYVAWLRERKASLPPTSPQPQRSPRLRRSRRGSSRVH
jgi:hypothetical protein